MRTEVCNAVDFLSNMVRNQGRLTAAQLERFRQTLLVLLCTHYQDHWFPDRPFKGSGYRCIRINNKMDPIVSLAGKKCGFTEQDLFRILPAELTLWVDPDEVSYRIGEEGSIAVLYESSDSEASSSSGESSSSGSPSPCPQDFNRHSMSSPMTSPMSSSQATSPSRDYYSYYDVRMTSSPSGPVDNFHQQQYVPFVAS